MKKLFLLILLPFITFAQSPEAEGELWINLINHGSSWNFTFTLTAISARWDENYELTEDYETASDNIHNPFGTTATFEHILHPGNYEEFAIGLYKISVIENGNELAYFYMDWRTSNWIWSLDVSFKYDVGNNRFRDSGDTETIDYSYQTLWDLTGNLLVTSGLEDFWENALVMTNNGRNPRMVWGPHPTFQATYYKVYRAVSATPLGHPEFFASVIATVSSSTYEYTDSDISFNSNGNYVYYFVKGYNGSYSGRTNIGMVRGGFYYKENTSGEDNQKLRFNLNQNYPNPFNPTTQIDYSITKAGLVTLKVYDILGNEVAILVNERREPGYYLTTLDADNLPSGIYFYQLRTENFADTKKMILLR